MTSVAANFFAAAATPALPGGGAGVGQPASTGFGALLAADLTGGAAPAATPAGDMAQPTTGIAMLLASTADPIVSAPPVIATPSPGAALTTPQIVGPSPTPSGPGAPSLPTDAAAPTQPIVLAQPAAAMAHAVTPATITPVAPQPTTAPIAVADRPQAALRQAAPLQAAPLQADRVDPPASSNPPSAAGVASPIIVATPAVPSTADTALDRTASPTAAHHDDTAPDATRSPTGGATEPAQPAPSARDHAPEDVPASVDLPLPRPDPILASMVVLMAPPPAAATVVAAAAVASTTGPDTVQASGSPDARGQIAGNPFPTASNQRLDPRVAAVDDNPGETPSGHDDDASSSGHATAPINRASALPPRDGVPAFSLPTALPATAASVRPAVADAITAQPGRIGQELGVAIARHVATGGATGGGETITLRLNPVDMGRIDVQLSFDDGGTLRAIVSADNPAALEMLRRDSADLGRALTDAGVRSDTQTLRFDTRQGGGNSQSGGQPWQRQPEPRGGMTADTQADATDDITAIHRPLRTRGRVDMVA